MNVSQLIPVEHISIGWPSRKIPQIINKWELITNSVEFLCEKAGLTQEFCSTAIQCVHDREKSMTTAIGHGIAIPHASIAELNNPVGACVILPEGMDFESIDHEPVHIIILLLLPAKDYKKHISILSNIVNFTSLPEIKNKLISSKTAEEVWKLISHVEG